jgi:hypothetical protein
MASRRSLYVQPDVSYGRNVSNDMLDPSRRYGSNLYSSAVLQANHYKALLTSMSVELDITIRSTHPQGKGVRLPISCKDAECQIRSASYPMEVTTSSFNPIAIPLTTSASLIRSEPMYSSAGYSIESGSAIYGTAGPVAGSYGSQAAGWETQIGRVSPDTFMDDFGPSSSPTDYQPESSSRSSTKSKGDRKGSSQQRRSSNRDEFDGPHQFLQPPPAEYIAQQNMELPHLPTNLMVQEQDSVLTQVNDRLSQCAFDFVAKYQFPVPLDPSCRKVEQPQDREWTEWVYLLKRLATKRRIPARVLYNGQIKQFITILENSLEMRHAAAHKSRPLKDDRNILQLISAGIQVAKLLRDACAMNDLDQLYVATERQIQERSASSRYL